MPAKRMLAPWGNRDGSAGIVAIVCIIVIVAIVIIIIIIIIVAIVIADALAGLVLFRADRICSASVSTPNAMNMRLFAAIFSRRCSS